MKAIALYFVIINLIAFAAMGIDKKRAQKQEWRIPESTLFLLVLLGGWLGGIAGMFIFHHKTKKLYFKVGFPMIMLIEIIMLLVRYVK